MCCALLKRENSRQSEDSKDPQTKTPRYEERQKEHLLVFQYHIQRHNMRPVLWDDAEEEVIKASARRWS